MKVGDLVKHRDIPGTVPGLVIDIIQKKLWNTAKQGNKVNWDLIKPEPHAVVLWAHNDGTISVPVNELVEVDFDG